MILIKNATIVGEKITNGDILIDGNRIIEIGKSTGERHERSRYGKADEIIDASGKIAIPGLVNTHTHVAMAILRGYGEDMPLNDWLQKKIWPAEAKLKCDDVKWGSLLGMAESIRCGVTTLNEMYIYHVEETAQAAEQIGMRIVLPRAMFDLIPGRRHENEIDEAAAFIKKWKGKGQLVEQVVSCHAPYTCSEELLRKAKELAKREKVKFHMHISETRQEVLDILKKTGKYPFEYIDSLGLLDENSIFAHASWVTKKEIALVGRKKASISHCPISNLKLATGGICPIAEYDAAGANVTIGTDSAASNNCLDMFESMKLAALLQKHHYWKADAIHTRKIFDFATINGANALGINTGKLEKGRLADIVLLERDTNIVPEHDMIANIVYSAGPQNVTDVMINGKIVLRNRKLITVDEEKIKKEAMKSANDLAQRS